MISADQIHLQLYKNANVDFVSCLDFVLFFLFVLHSDVDSEGGSFMPLFPSVMVGLIQVKPLFPDSF